MGESSVACVGTAYAALRGTTREALLQRFVDPTQETEPQVNHQSENSRSSDRDLHTLININRSFEASDRIEPLVYDDGLDQSFTSGDIDPFRNGNGSIAITSTSELDYSASDPSIFSVERVEEYFGGQDFESLLIRVGDHQSLVGSTSDNSEGIITHLYGEPTDIDALTQDPRLPELLAYSGGIDYPLQHYVGDNMIQNSTHLQEEIRGLFTEYGVKDSEGFIKCFAKNLKLQSPRDLQAFSKALGLPLHSDRLAKCFRTIGRLFDLTECFEQDQMASVALNPPLTTLINEAIKAVSNLVLIRVLEGEYPSLRAALSIELELPKHCDQMDRLISLLNKYIYLDEWDFSLELIGD